LAAVFVPALAICAFWWGRNLTVYGWPDFLGLERHDSIILVQPRTAEWLAAYGPAGYLARFAGTTFRSFWGQFGWMGVVMDGRVYGILLAFSLFVLAGCALALRQEARAPALSAYQREGLAVLAFSGLLTGALYLLYNVELVQHQGRYLFPALVPLAIGAALGLRAWARLAAGGTPAAEWLPLGAVACLAALDVLALYRFILPALPRF
jgi:hypothetical protein